MSEAPKMSATPDLARIRESLITMEHMPEALYEFDRLVEQFEALRKVARDLYDDAGVDDIDARLDYLMLQVGREVWNDYAAFIEDSIPASRFGESDSVADSPNSSQTLNQESRPE